MFRYILLQTAPFYESRLPYLEWNLHVQCGVTCDRYDGYHEAQRALGTMEGYAYLDGSNMQLLFSANKVLELVQQVGDHVSSLSSLLATLKTLASNVENLYLGFEFTKA